MPPHARPFPRPLAALVALLALAWPAPSARAGFVVLGPARAASATTTYDGLGGTTFAGSYFSDRVSTSRGQRGTADLQTAYAFDLRGLAAGSIAAVTLDFLVVETDQTFVQPPSLSTRATGGLGPAIDLEVFRGATVGGSFGAASGPLLPPISPADPRAFAYDLTALAAALVDAGVPYLVVTFTAGGTGTAVRTTTPTLSVATAVPGPPALVLVGTGLVVLAGVRPGRGARR